LHGEIDIGFFQPTVEEFWITTDLSLRRDRALPPPPPPPPPPLRPHTNTRAETDIDEGSGETIDGEANSLANAAAIRKAMIDDFLYRKEGEANVRQAADGKALASRAVA